MFIVWQVASILLGKLNCTSKVHRRIALPSGLPCQPPLRDQTVYTYLTGNSRSVSRGILQCCGTSLAACLFRNEAAVQVLPAPAYTDPSAFLFLNQMCFYWVQFRFPRRYKYALGRSDSGPGSALHWLVCRPANWLEHLFDKCMAGWRVKWLAA